MLELDEFCEFTLPEGEIWIGDPCEVLPEGVWATIQTRIIEIESFRGYTGIYADYVEFFLIDQLFEEIMLTLNRREKGMDNSIGWAEDTAEKITHVADFTPDSGYVIMLARDHLERMLGGQSVESLDTGDIIELDAVSDVRVNYRGVFIGTSFLLNR